MTDPGGILFATSPAIGLSNPLLAMAGELKRRGVRNISFATNDDRKGDVEELTGDGEVAFASLGTYLDRLWPWNYAHRDFSSTTMRRRLANIARYFEAAIDYEYFHEQFLLLIELIKEVKPLLIVADINTPYAVDAALMCGIPYVANISTPPSMAYAPKLPASYPAPMSGLPERMDVRQRLSNLGFKAGMSAVTNRPKYYFPMRGLYRLRRKGGFVNDRMIPWRYAESAAVVLGDSVFGIDYEFPAPPNLRMIGAVLPSDAGGEGFGGELGGWLDRHGSVVYHGFGTLMQLSREQVAAFVEVARRLGPDHHVLWKLSAAQQELLPAGLPANLRVESWLPSQLAVINHPHVRVFFNHGGANAVHESLYFGTPMLVMPFWLDCYDLAVRVVDSGAGLAVEHRPDPDVGDVVGKLRRLLTEDSFATRAGYWSQRLRAAGGAATAADVILAVHGTVLAAHLASAAGRATGGEDGA